MMQVVVVSMTPNRFARIAHLLEESGYYVITARGFDKAIRALADHSPALLISELRLGAFNGLHLVIRSHIAHPAMRTILLDHTYDSVLESEAQSHGAVYLVEPIDEVEILAEVSRLRRDLPQRRWPRKQLPGDHFFGAHVAHRPVRVVDLSYGGLRLEVLEPADVATGFEVAFPTLGLGIRAKSVWTCAAPTGSFWCGAELSDTDPQAMSAWRTLVDSVHEV